MKHTDVMSLRPINISENQIHLKILDHIYNQKQPVLLRDLVLWAIVDLLLDACVPLNKNTCFLTIIAVCGTLVALLSVLSTFLCAVLNST